MSTAIQQVTPEMVLIGKVIQHGMISAGRYLALRFWLDDKPGRLHDITQLLAEHNVNILHIATHRRGPYMALHKVELELIVETRDHEHGQEVLRLVRAAGYDAEEAVDPRGPFRASLSGSPSRTRSTARRNCRSIIWQRSTDGGIR